MPIDMTKASRRDRELAAEIFLHDLISAQVVRSCLNCAAWAPNGAAKAAELCLKFNATPPAQVIVYACEMWDADIPF